MKPKNIAYHSAKEVSCDQLYCLWRSELQLESSHMLKHSNQTASAAAKAATCQTEFTPKLYDSSVTKQFPHTHSHSDSGGSPVLHLITLNQCETSKFIQSFHIQ